MPFPYHLLSGLKVVFRNVFFQIVLFLIILLIWWGGQSLYRVIDQTRFPVPCAMPEQANTLSEIEKGKILLDALTHQMRYELSSTFGWSFNDILFHPVILDNRAYRQYGVYHATKFLLDLYSTDIAKLGKTDKESEFLYRARINQFAIDPRRFWFPSAESAYKQGFKLLEEYKHSLDTGKGVFNCRTDDLYTAFKFVVDDNLLGYALGLLQNAQDLPFYTLDNRIYEAQGIVLVVRDFINSLYILYPEIKAKNNEENMKAANLYMDRICTYDPLYITSSFNSGELIISYLLFARARLDDIAKSLKM
ncbi:MAG: LacI family DNA-binding transcriptional regulator [Desulfovibrio sp.]|nr:LacI family DNA-binding transcriptional regulator [Desulfovibrio sp.]